MAITLMLAFVVSCFPYLGMTIKSFTARKSTSLSWCTWNPFICIIFNNNFRKGFKEILQTCFSCCCIISIKYFKRDHIGNLRAHVREPVIELADIQVIRMAALET